MDGLVVVVALIAAVSAFVWLVRRTKRQSAELQKARPWEGQKPKPLSASQRESLKLAGQQPKPQYTASTAQPTAKPNRSTRAIRTGWSMGDVEFTYEDSAGDITRRRVTVHSVTQTYLKGGCHDRQAERTFRLDRIIGDVVNCDTGEILSPRTLEIQAKS